ncbi:MAG: MoxR family ATPase, partial [Elusimicrobia bacterium]|nr:MoxR family ATPase [Elusimicrobiota bacterium]
MNLNDAKLLLETALDARLPIMLWGPPGVGKSAVVAAAAS